MTEARARRNDPETSAAAARDVEMKGVDALEASVIENGMRADVHPLEESEGYHALLALGDYDVAMIAAKTGHSITHVHARLQLSNLIEPAKRALSEEHLAIGHANLIARLLPKDQATALEQVLQAERYGGAIRTVRGLAEWIERNVHLDLSSAPWSLMDAELDLAAGACIACTKRTGTTPALFPDVKQKDTCLDRECYARKRAAFVEREIEKEKEKHQLDLVRLSTDYTLGTRKAKRGETPPLPASGWVKVPKGKKACNDTRPAIVVEGFGGTIGERFNVCIDPKCDVHHGQADEEEEASLGDDSYRKAEAEAERKAKRERVERRAILDATLERVFNLDEHDYAAVVIGLVEGLPSATKIDLVKRHGWEIAEREVFGSMTPDYSASVLNALAGDEVTGQALARLVLEIALLHTLAVGTNGSADPKLLLATAKRHGVNVAEVRKAAHEEKTLAKARAELKDAGKGKKARTKKGATRA